MSTTMKRMRRRAGVAGALALLAVLPASAFTAAPAQAATCQYMKSYSSASYRCKSWNPLDSYYIAAMCDTPQGWIPGFDEANVGGINSWGRWATVNCNGYRIFNIITG